MSHIDSDVCYRQQYKNDWLSDDVVYRTRGETTGGVSCTSACLNLVLNNWRCELYMVVFEFSFKQLAV